MKRDWKIRLDKVTYGLMYPAFIGNMVYDVINIWLRKDTAFHFSFKDTLIIAILIIIFVSIDYMHLNGDVNSIFREPEYKSRYYFFCDIATPILLFIAFVFLRNNEYFNWGVISFFLVPGVIFIYKRSNPKSKWYFAAYSVLSLLFGLGIIFVEKMKSAVCLELSILLNIIGYAIYMIWYYPNKSRQFDIEYINKIKSKNANE